MAKEPKDQHPTDQEWSRPFSPDRQLPRKDRALAAQEYTAYCLGEIVKHLEVIAAHLEKRT